MRVLESCLFNATVVVAFAACQHSQAYSPDAGLAADAPAADAGGAWTDLNPPAPLPATSPGYLSITPLGLELNVGSSTQLRADRFDSAGNPVAGADVTWASSDPSIATISPTGVLNAIAPGEVEIAATDTQLGTWRVTETVTTTPTSGPHSVSFSRPAVQLHVGDTLPLQATATDASGQTIAASLVFSSSQSSIASVTATTLTATGAGLTTITASVGGTTLSGQMNVLVVPWTTSGSGCVGNQVISCSKVLPPSAYSSPGMSDALAVYVCRSPAQCTEPVQPASCEVVAPTRVSALVLNGSQVVTIGSDGLLQAVQPGTTSLREYVDDFQCDGDDLIEVTPDLNGTWAATCDNQDQGTFTVSTWPRRINHYPYAPGQGYGGGQASPMTYFGSGELSCLTSSDQSYSCVAPASQINPHFSGYASDEPFGGCSQTHPCDAGGLMAACFGPFRHGSSWHVLGPDQLLLNGSDMNGQMAPGGACHVTRDSAATCNVSSSQLMADGTTYSSMNPKVERNGGLHIEHDRTNSLMTGTIHNFGAPGHYESTGVTGASPSFYLDHVNTTSHHFYADTFCDPSRCACKAVADVTVNGSTITIQYSGTLEDQGTTFGCIDISGTIVATGFQ